MRRGSLGLPVAWILCSALLATGCAPQTLTDTSRDTMPTPGTPGGSPAAPPAPSQGPAEPTPPAAPQQPPGGETVIPPDSSPQQPEGPEAGAGAARGSVEVIDTVATDIPIPWGLAELPDRTVLITSRDEHHVYRLAPRSGKIVDLGEIAGVDSDGGEGGLLGVAVARDFQATKRIYLYYSTPSDNRIAYVTLLPGAPASLSEATVVLSGIPRGYRHNGGRIAFGPDGMLYVSTGDTEVPELAQDTTSLGGKILRMTPLGRPAPGNPFGPSVVYSYGHRNVQGLAFDRAGNLFASEFGDSTADELNWIRPGRNYGWPASEGATELEGVTDPVAQFGTEEDSPSGIALAGGSVYMAALQGQRLWRIPLAGTELAAEPRPFLVGELGRLRSVIALDETTLLLATSNTDGRIVPLPGDDKLLLVRVS